MKMNVRKYASLVLVAAGFLLGPVLNAQASTCYPTWLRSYTSCFSRTRDNCSYVNYNYNCKSVCGNSYSSNTHDDSGSNCNNGSGGTTTPPPPVVAGSIAITPTGQIAGIGTTISIVAPYTAPANSSAQITLYEDEVPIAVYVIPATSTSGNATFSVDVPGYLDVSVFQVQLTYTVVTPSGSSSSDCHERYDSDCGRSKHHYRHGRECDDDDDDDDGTPVTTVLDSEYLIVVRPGGGGGQSG